MKFFRAILRLPRYPVLLVIYLYQKTISPDHGLAKDKFPHGYCPYHPTCSEYGFQAIKKHGLILGVPKTAWRIVRCNPWTKGGVDLP
ncbi:membrane protein insertion efficiency factor YidD [Patescibacteria group bacterium]|nr:membrane protein insertion efficiency factor YidD [Patescibacteria group bacterium]MBU1721299.1 membrane protein insertion efficiency factor YidD [Patescibacteria group bacterium]MBU1900825.1 membrane protein insertion efficiency factor YidD [Patescibacteria group bacterium]